jgi:hypothetical protein
VSKKVLSGIVALMLATLACSTLSSRASRVVGSGHEASESRNVTDFDSVELAGSGDVNILLGDTQSVNVQADDNILPLIETTVSNNKLLIRTKPFTDITHSSPIVVTVVMKSLKQATLSGSGNMNIGAMSGPDLTLDLPGSGNITAEGTVDALTIHLAGSGNVTADKLKAHSANATVAGSGDISLFASDSLDASVSGSGTIRCEGNPAQVTKSVTGSGSITP